MTRPAWWWTGAASYSGVCGYDCGTPIEVGQPIETTGEREGRQYGHVVCPEPADLAADRAALAAPRCPRCTGNHPGEC